MVPPRRFRTGKRLKSKRPPRQRMHRSRAEPGEGGGCTACCNRCARKHENAERENWKEYEDIRVRRGCCTYWALPAPEQRSVTRKRDEPKTCCAACCRCFGACCRAGHARRCRDDMKYRNKGR